ncbi:MAG TPA: CoA transferase [Solimonas sp.]|nr:CoA transferase [Solimonas sp.]
MSNPMLAGLRVLDFSRLLPGPFCTLYLAQLGAEVVKLEEPNGGDYARTLNAELFELVNQGKKSVTLDLRKAEGAALLLELVRNADVLVESFRPGVMDRLGCGYETLRAANPRLVYCAITGYGQSGPYRDRAGHDMNYNGYAGVLDQTGAAGGPPVLSNFQYADLAGGALTAAVGILSAVLGARASGEGAFVDISMHEGTLALQVLSLTAIRALGQAQPRGADMLSGGLPNYSIYECADGRHVALAALEQKFFVNFCNAAGRPDLARKPLAPGKAGAALREEIAALFRSKPRDEWDRLLADKDCCVSAILSPDEVLVNEHVLARGMVRQLHGKPAFGSPIRLHGAPVTGPSPAPGLGADTVAVLEQAGVDAGRLAALRAARAV